MKLSRRHALFLAPAAVLAVGAAGAVWIGTHAAPATAIGGPFQLVDGDGKTLTDRDFRGKWMLLYFGYTHCPDACPTALQDMANALDALGAKKREVKIVFITIDPERDTPAAMKEYVSAFEAPITVLSGSPAAIAEVAKEYKVYYAKHKTEDGYDMDHTNIVYVMDPTGRFVTIFSGDTSSDQMAAKLRELV